MKPFIIKLRTKNNFYIYDVNTNNFLKVDKVVYKMIDDIYDLSVDAILNKWRNQFAKNSLLNAITNVKKNIKEEGLFSSFRPKKFKHCFSKKEIKRNLNNTLTNLCLEITQQCNMRCSYCSYSGKFPYKRTHNNTWMSFNIAKKAIDFFLTHSKETERKFISFYGGEPLLNFSLIKKCINYINEKSDEKIYCGITTNGTLLNEKILKFLLQMNKVHITISLDGPKKIHDRYRKFPSGEGTYDLIINNIKKIKQICQNISSLGLMFNVTIAPPYKLNEQKKYFDSLCKENDYMVNPFHVNTDESNLSKGEKISFKQDFNRQINNIKKIFRMNLIENKVDSSPFLRKLFSNRYRKIYKRGIFKSLVDYHYPNGTCVPGWAQLFVDSTGSFFTCEKMTDFYSIGNINSGFDFKMIFSLLDEYSEICNMDCLDCWAIRLCHACFVNAKKRGEIDIEKKRKYCKFFKRNLMRDLIFYLEVLENNPDAFNYMENEIVSVRNAILDNKLKEKRIDL
ncbi:MAG: radical SAM protein [Candidatus Aminicenantes bacterium]|nr:radical SAM protein [Candidatus Aminicenantes bacterium]